MNSLALRKQLLIAGSELNRAQLLHDWQTITSQVHAISCQVRTFGSLVSSATSLICGLLVIQRQASGPVGGKTSWWQTLLRAVELVRTFWSELRPPGPKPE